METYTLHKNVPKDKDSEELAKIKSLVANLKGATDIISEVDAWYPVYEAYLNHHIGLAAVNKSIPGIFGHLRVTQSVETSLCYLSL